jgi:tetratricopeptide (TPR) repeat protein
VVLTTSTRPLVLPRRIHQVAALAALAASAILLPTLVRRIGSQHALHGAERASDRLDDPRPLLVRARRIDPTDGEAALGLGLAHLVEREPERALVELRVARARFADVGTSVAIGNAELALGRPLAAVASYREALRLDPGSFRARANLVEALRSAGELDSARAELAVARTLQPHHPKLEAIAERLRRSEVDDGTR